MQKRNKREKAGDIFNKSEPVFGSKVSFDKAFPEIKDLDVEVSETGEGIYSNDKMIYHKEYFPGEFINCSNSLCYSGGFRIGSILHDMIRERMKEREVSADCIGYKGSPKGKKRYGYCPNHFKVKIVIQYND